MTDAASGSPITETDTLLNTPVEPVQGPVGLFVDQITDMLAIGGPVVAILLVLSLVATTITFAKLMQFFSVRLRQQSVTRNALMLWQAGRQREAVQLAASSRNPTARALAQAMRGQLRGIEETKIREEVVRVGAGMLEALRSWLRPLEVIASLAPLLGLFGTVLGMIDAFAELENAGNQVDPSVLSGGIWEALLTTAVGLAVAIPTVAVLNCLESCVDRTAHEMDSAVTRIFTEDLSADITFTPGHAGHESAPFRPAAVPGK